MPIRAQLICDKCMKDIGRDYTNPAELSRELASIPYINSQQKFLCNTCYSDYKAMIKAKKAMYEAQIQDWFNV